MKKLISILLSTLIVFGIANLSAVSIGLAAAEEIPTFVVCPKEDPSSYEAANPRLYGASYPVYDEYDERAQEMPYPKEDTFKLHSLKGSKKTLYLDFNGHTTTSTLWNYPDPRVGGFGSSLYTPPFDIDGNKNTNFTDLEHAAIQQIWQAVAEDYAIFDVNVTTEDPGEAKLERTSSTDTEYGMRACIGGRNTDWLDAYDTGTCGIAYLDIFGVAPLDYQLAGITKTAPAMVFSENLLPGGTTFTYNLRQIALSVSHELGHTLSLEHDGIGGWFGSEYTGSDGSWTPIMGYAAGGHVSQWSKGEYPGASNGEDDIALIAARTGYVTDKEGNSAANAVILPIKDNKATKKGVINSSTDKDYFAFTLSDPALVDITANPGLAFNDANLDIKLSLYSSDQTLIETSNVTEATFDFKHDPFNWYAKNYEESHELMKAGFNKIMLDAGAYYILVENTGATFYNEYNVNYTTYGSVGNYTLDIKTDPNFITDLSLDKETLTIAKNTTAQLNVLIAPYNATNQNVTWNVLGTTVVEIVSSNNSYAVIKGLEPGEAIVTATTEQGNISTYCEITVFDPAAPGNDQTSVDFVYNYYKDILEKTGKAAGSDEYIIYIEDNLSWINTPLAGATLTPNVTSDVTSGTYFTNTGTVTRPPNNWREQIGDVLAECPYYSVTVQIKKGTATPKTLSFGVKVVPECVYGDTDNNGTVNAVDALLALKMVIGTAHNDYHIDRYTYSGYRADEYYDYVLTASDPFAILKNILN